MAALARSGEMETRMVRVNGQPGRLVRGPAEIGVLSVLTVDVVDGRIQAVRIVRNPDKLSRVGAETPLSRGAGR